MGKNWMDPSVIIQCSKVSAALSMVLTGVACWDVMSTLWFEWQIITGKRKWKLTMLIYIVARIAMLLHIFAITINLNALGPVPCSGLAFVSKFGDAVGTCASSLILGLRTRSVWHRDLRITIFMGVLFIGQMVMWIHTFRYSKAAWNNQRKLCDVISTSPRGLMVSVWAYTMVFDFIILLLCTYRLISHRTSTLGHILLRDGISYFCFAFAANLVRTIMAGLQLNPIMNIITIPFACVVSVIAATTVFRNVFTAYDAFSRDVNAPSSKLSSSPDGHLRTGPNILFNRNTTTQRPDTGDYQFGTHKLPTNSHNIGPISVHKIVDVKSDNDKLPDSDQMICHCS